MDGAITPIYSSAFDSFDEESQPKDTNLISSNNRIMQPIPEDIELLKPSSSSSGSGLLGFETEFNLDLCQYFEDVPLNMEEFNEQYTYNSMLGTLVALPANNNNNDNNDDILPFHPMHQDISNNNSNSLNHVFNYDDGGDAAASDRSHLQLPLNSAVRLQDEISTPAIIQMLLEGAENVTHQVPPAAYENVPAVVEIVEMEMASQTKGIQKRASSDSGEDLRRLRNNEASRKSRQNRRERLTGQVSMLSQLEKENQQLIVKVKELEQLKSEMMKYLKKDGP